jgi:hypothetical protein
MKCQASSGYLEGQFQHVKDLKDPSRIIRIEFREEFLKIL